MNNPKQKQEPGRLAEKIRRANSGDSAYQHLLDTIADGINAEFFTGEMVQVITVSEFVRRFQP